MEYVPLHVHTDASLDGAGTVTSLLAEAKRIGLKALAMTDHGTLANAVAFWSACTDVEIKPILGLEAYLLYHGNRHHITLLSLNENGFNNLIALDTWSHVENYVGSYPMITLDKLYTHQQGILALSGCASSALFVEDESLALMYLQELRDACELTYLEMMFVGDRDTWSRPLSFEKKTHIPVVVTNDSHYPCQSQFHAHQTITSARRGFTYDSQHLWLKTAKEIWEKGVKHVESDIVRYGLANTVAIAASVESWNMKSPPSLPHIADAKERLHEHLVHEYHEDTRHMTKAEKELRLTRLRTEFRILHERGFLDYIFILWDIVRFAKGKGIRVGPGRGSGGGSYVLYLLGVTSIDPIQHELVFERFLNPSRSDYPDVDVDFESDRRDEVLNYAKDIWGAIPIATYSTYSHKSAVHDIARVLAIPKDTEIPAADSGQDSDAFKEFVESNPAVLSVYNTMLGQIRHRGKHAAGVIIPNRPVPIERAGDQLVAAWAEGQETKDLSKVGIVKYDLLSLSALSMLRRMEELTGVKTDAIEWNFKDGNVYDLFCDGDVAGIFQWSGSEGIRELTRRIAPRNFYDLTTCNALYRPGALDAGTAERYPHFMAHPRKLHPRIDPYLEKTYGVICYQEQVMAVVAEVMGGDLAQADIARRLISKAAVGDLKWEAEMAGLYAGFMLQGTEQGFDEKLLDNLWHEVYTHSRYSYNLAHASAYTMISYQMAWFKVNFRAAFTTAVLQYDKANAQTYILDAVANGLKVEMPHVNYSTANYELKDNTIYLPLSDVAFLGEKALQKILEEREKVLGFNFYEEFAKAVPKKVCNNRTKGMLERIGAFRGLEGDVSAIIDNYRDLPLLDKYTTQLEIIGYVVPSKQLIEKMELLRNRPAKRDYTSFAGFISEVKHKRSEHGEYTVFNLSPEGSFWMRKAPAHFVVGKFVAGSKSRFGHSNDVRSYKLGD